MDYLELAHEFIRHTTSLKRMDMQKSVTTFLQGEMFVMQYLDHNKEAIPSEISAAANTSTARIAATLNSLEKKGFISREIDSSDRRRILVKLTEAGLEQSAKFREEMLSGVVWMLKSLGDEDAKEFVRIVGKLPMLIPPGDRPF